MTPTLPPSDWRGGIRRRVAAHRLAQAAAANPAPVLLQTGHFAPPNAYAVWHLPCPGGAVLQIVARQGDREITLRILPEGE
jgi:hypothetical protein